MAKTLTGQVVSTKMTGSVVVEVTRKTPHPKYQKLLTKSKRFVVDPAGKEVKEGDTVKIAEIRKVAKNKNFAIVEVLS